MLTFVLLAFVFSIVGTTLGVVSLTQVLALKKALARPSVPEKQGRDSTQS